MCMGENSAKYKELIRALRIETNEILKPDMQSDIIVLLNRKKFLADMKNFTIKVLIK